MVTKVGSNQEALDMEQMKKDLIIQWLNKKSFLSDKAKHTLFEMGCQCFENVGFLYDIHKAVIQRQDIQEVKGEEFTLVIEDDRCTLRFGGEELEFQLSQLREVIIGIIDIVENILPLGTVVDLKKQYLQKYMGGKVIENIRIIITHRFLYHETDTTFFPYGGVIYPLGMFEEKQIIHFTPALIENVVHTGYSDIQDEAFIYMMKKELVLEKDMHSYGFSTEKERNKFENRLQTEEKQHDEG